VWRFVGGQLTFVAAAGLALAAPALADDARIGVGVDPVGAGVTVGSDHRDHDRERTVIKKDEPGDRERSKVRSLVRPPLRP
jgi:hypothetical protein